MAIAVRAPKTQTIIIRLTECCRTLVAGYDRSANVSLYTLPSSLPCLLPPIALWAYGCVFASHYLTPAPMLHRNARTYETRTVTVTESVPDGCRTASSATQELDDLMASLSDFKVQSRTVSLGRERWGHDLALNSVKGVDGARIETWW